MANVDPFAKVGRGDPFKFKAEVYNAIIELLAANRIPGLGGGRKLPGSPENETAILVRNKTGADLPQFGIVAISTPSILQTDNDPAFRSRRFWEGDTPSTTATIAITQEPIAKGNTGSETTGRIGPAIIVGETPAKVNVSDATHKYCVPSTSTSVLNSATAGPIKLLWYDASGGTTGDNKWARVLLLGEKSASDAISPPFNCGPYEKIYGKVINVSGTYYQRWKMQDCCCNVIATGCDPVPAETCGDETPGTCLCNASNPTYWVFEFPSYTSQPGLPSPTNWCMAKCAPNFPAVNGCCYVYSELVCNGLYCAAWRATVTVNADGSATVTVSNAVADVQYYWYATYYISTWNCNASNTLSLIDHYSYGDMFSFPATLQVNTAANADSCAPPPPGGGGGGSAHDCADCAATTWKVTIAGTTNGTCTVCSAMNVTNLVMTNISSCQWQAFVGNITCGGFGTAVSATLIDNGTTGWELTLSGLVTYFLAYASWSCTAANTMNKISGTGQCTWPATITVQKNS